MVFHQYNVPSFTSAIEMANIHELIFKVVHSPIPQIWFIAIIICFNLKIWLDDKRCYQFGISLEFGISMFVERTRETILKSKIFFVQKKTCIFFVRQRSYPIILVCPILNEIACQLVFIPQNLYFVTNIHTYFISEYIKLAWQFKR